MMASAIAFVPFAMVRTGWVLEALGRSASLLRGNAIHTPKLWLHKLCLCSTFALLLWSGRPQVRSQGGRPLLGSDLTMVDDETARAYRAYFSAAKRRGDVISPSQPSSRDSGPQEVRGKRYIVLRNVNGILAVYRVRQDGMLKGLRRWPKELESY
jgi:hypothetical protein